MRVTFIGHAGLYIEAAGRTILCDPWFNPAYYASWFPFPANHGIDMVAVTTPDYLYLSHLHQDHFDPDFLTQRVDRSATVLLPEFPLDEQRRALEDVGFEEFQVLPHGVPVDLGGGLRVMAAIASGPSDGPFGDSALAVDDGTARIVDQNDARPRDLDAIARFGPYDGHFLQFSGAIWYPVVYDMPDEAKAEAGRAKRLRGMERAALFADQIDASFLFPCAGPPCFLDENLFGYNDLDGDDTNPFPDQTVFLDYLRQRGHDNARLIVPGSEIHLEHGHCHVEHPSTDAEVMAPFRNKAAYLHAYRESLQPFIDAARRSWPRPGEVDVVGELQRWWEPLLAKAGWLCDRIGAPVLLEAGDVGVVVDFPARKVRAHEGEHCPFRFSVEPGVMEAAIKAHEPDWVNGLFLSMRFRAARDGGYNEHIYTFFKCLSEERLAYAETWARGNGPGSVESGLAGPDSTGATSSLAASGGATGVGGPPDGSTGVGGPPDGSTGVGGPPDGSTGVGGTGLIGPRAGGTGLIGPRAGGTGLIGLIGEPGRVAGDQIRDPDADEWCVIGDWRIQGRCPHLQGDLERFGSIEAGVLTCKLHGHQFDLPTRRCLTTGEPDAIRAERLPGRGDSTLDA